MTASTPTSASSSRYDPSSFEEPVSARWAASGLATPPVEPGPKGAFTIMIPPPNVTGMLHMGHALNNTMQDVVARHRRLCGFDVLWVPGTDHAGIATQAVVEKKLFADGEVTREDLGREKFLAEIWKWKEQHGNAILEQLRRLGSSCDWTRTKFTLDEDLSRAVRVSFVKLWEKDLIYRGSRLVNWDCKLQTAVSDDEIEHVQRKGKMWYLRYPVQDCEEQIVVATTRPETMLGDTGVAVHPDDERWAHLVGRLVQLPILNRSIPIVADESVDPSLGTGAVKITPGHDPADYERGARHKLPILNILEKDGSLNQEGGPFVGLAREKARIAVVSWFEEHDLLEKVEDIVHNISISDRSKTAIEPLVSEQWFVNMDSLAGPAKDAVKNGSLNFKPARWAKVYLDWLENVHDWCISRQLWWGHRIPVWYDEDGVAVASVETLDIGATHPISGRPIVRQDEDVLDTWASSWLWPFATLGWPEHSADLKRFYPTQFLSTARDIIYLWVARMVMAGYEFLDHLPMEQRCPFSTCAIHATVLDAQGRRMSKSLGNGIDPVAMIDNYGADAVRFSLMILTREGQDVKLAENRFEFGQRFCNKIWNVSRFVLDSLDPEIAPLKGPPEALEDRWILSRLACVTEEVSQALDQFEFHDAAQALYRFTWDDYCDWYIEAAKRRLRAAKDASAGSPAQAEADTVRQVLAEVLSALLRLLHPFTPFLTESLWPRLPGKFRGDADLLMAADWPQPGLRDAVAEATFASLRDAVRGFRNVRALLEIPVVERPDGLLLAKDAELGSALTQNSESLCFLAGLGQIEVRHEGGPPTDSGTDVFDGGSVFLPFRQDTDVARLRALLEKKLGKVENGLGGIEKKLGNARFLENADPETVESERLRSKELQGEAATLRANLQGLG